MNKENPPIFAPYEAFYLCSLHSCALSAMISAKWLEKFFSEHRDDLLDVHPQPVMNQLQNVAIQGAAISRFFWPREKYKRRGEYLRQVFEIDNDNPLRSRALRNRMEHYDEYLDNYLEKAFVVGRILPDYIGPEPTGNVGVQYHLFRAYFVDTGRVSILGVGFELQPIVDAICGIQEIVQKCLKDGSRFPGNGPNQAGDGNSEWRCRATLRASPSR